ncbi:hypothetical protein [Terasakiella pusilla]|uniref:hypothetical protein n=1 Tax=Terasakiella pusilla TaxID=64973 RepID=UPI003AA9A36A
MLHKLFHKNFLIVLLVAMGVSACGYQPLHGNRKTAQNTKMKNELARIWINEIPDREGQQLHNELLNLFNVKGRPAHPKYKLKVSYNESTSGLGIGKDEFATRANMSVSATFHLSGAVTFSGVSQSVVTYNILTSPTGTEFAKRDARKRAIENVATDIHRRITVHLLSAKTEQ